MSNFIKHIYNDSTLTEEWSTILDGEWPFGELETKEVKHNCNFYNE